MNDSSLDYLPANDGDWETGLRRLMQDALPSGKLPRQGRLGPGDYATHSFLPPISFANMLFVQALEELVPGAIQDARRERYEYCVRYQEFLALLADRGRARFGRFFESLHDPGLSSVSLSSRMRRVWSLLDEWSKWFTLRHGEEAALATYIGKLEWMAKWHIWQPLVVDAVFDLAFAHATGMPISPLGDTLPEAGPITGFLAPFAPRGNRVSFIPAPSHAPVELALPSWDPSFETRAAFEQRVREAFETQLQQELDAIEDDSRRVGVPTPVKNGDRHFRWLVCYQVMEQSYNQIARSEGVRRQTVTEGVREAASLLDLPLRENSPPGRPRKAAGSPKKNRNTQDNFAARNLPFSQRSRSIPLHAWTARADPT